MRNASLLTVAILVAATAGPAIAQSNPYARTGPQPRDSYGSYRSESPAASRSSSTGPYAAPAGSREAIHWNTPNRDGNLGGPSTGGSPGSGG